MQGSEYNEDDDDDDGYNYKEDNEDTCSIVWS